ncbi:MAG TPA: superoxide dismutase family protein [Thermomonas sp.]|jgi:Cu-Zn family superoxide dismutase|uniref:superoxide dismutase family protein n=1 Tax=Thermomonas sp. TaxID=1971895 RepID=UPI002BA7A096|nr:superoxide dismutase family protein [Thermomonas sp.]HOV96481.1 superoxide dismutase family protein [Thermomonas sp.]
MSSLPKATFAAALAIGLTACASAPSPTDAPPAAAPTTQNTSTAKQAIANLASASGSLVSGRLTLVPMGGGVHIRGDIGGLPPGSSHGFHIHEKGDCSAVDAASAGGHFNPAGKPHGRAGHGAHHAGDSDNLVADAQGVAHVDAHVEGVSLGGGASNDILGRAIIVHANADDYSSQPAGNAGARVACGVIRSTP